MERIGLGMWDKSWGWGDREMVVKTEDIAHTVSEMMGNELLKLQAHGTLEKRLEGRLEMAVVLRRVSLLSSTHGRSFRYYHVKPSFLRSDQKKRCIS
ncbi:hypothetical protein ACFX1X_045689 [Malus domestica]